MMQSLVQAQVAAERVSRGEDVASIGKRKAEARVTSFMIVAEGERWRWITEGSLVPCRFGKMELKNSRTASAL